MMIATALAAMFLLASSAMPASAAHTVEQDGLVNVSIGDVTIQDVNVAVAAQIIANVCANVQNVNTAVGILSAIDQDASGATEFECMRGSRGRAPTLTVTQN